MVFSCLFDECDYDDYDEFYETFSFSFCSLFSLLAAFFGALYIEIPAINW